jgi:hypothetical protein
MGPLPEVEVVEPDDPAIVLRRLTSVTGALGENKPLAATIALWEPPGGS